MRELDFLSVSHPRGWNEMTDGKKTNNSGYLQIVFAHAGWRTSIQ